MMAGDYVLPSLIPDEDGMDAGKMLAQMRISRSSSNSQIHEDGISNLPLPSALRYPHTGGVVVPSARVSSRSSRSIGSYSSRPPSSFRAFTKADSDTTSNSSHAFPPSSSSSSIPSIRKRTSSLTLDAKTRANAAYQHYPNLHHQQKALPSTPMSATPSLTFSHSRTASRTDSEAFASSSSPSRYSPEYRRHAIIDFSESLDVLDSFEEEYAHLQSGNKFGSLSQIKSAQTIPNEDDSFLSLADDDDDDDDAIVRPAARKKQVAFKTKSQRFPPELFAEENGRTNPLIGQLSSQSTISLISPTKAGLRSLFSSITRGRSGTKRDDIIGTYFDSDGESSRERERERKRVESQPAAAAKKDTTTTDYGSIRSQSSRSSRKASGKEKIKASSQTAIAVVVADKGKGRDLSDLNQSERSQIQQSVFYDQQKEGEALQILQSNDSDTALKSNDTQTKQQERPATAGAVESKPQGRRLNRPSTAGNTDGMRHSTAGLTESQSVTSTYDEKSTPRKTKRDLLVPPSRPFKKSQSIDALYEMLQPCLLEQQERERRETSANPPSPVIEWPQSAPEMPMTLAEIRRRTEDLERRIKMNATIGREQTFADEKQTPFAAGTDRQTDIGLLDTKPVTISAPVQKTDVNVDLLPPLTSHLAQCIAQDRKEAVYPWKSDKERGRLLTASSPQSAVPKSWSGYVQAYAKGDFDLSNPPFPRSLPLVNRAAPRSPATPSMPGAKWSTSPPNVPRTRMASKESLQSLDDFYDLPGAHSSNNLLPMTPPAHQSFRDRLSSPRFASVRKGRSREASQENAKISRQSEEEVRVQAEDLAAVGGMGDIKGPRPLWEAERVASARSYLRDCSHQSSSHLQTIVERLSSQLRVSCASVQILLPNESVILASTGLNEEILAPFRAIAPIDPMVQGWSDKAPILLRDETLDAHTILQRDGSPFVVPDLAKDWRFEGRKSGNLPFYAGVSLLASDTGLPIGTISVMHHQAKEMSRDEKEALVEMAREVERELQEMRSKALEKKLEKLDRRILGWEAEVRTKASETINASSPVSPPSSEAVLTSRLRSALQTIISDLQVDVAYIARVGSDPLQCKIQVQQESDAYQAGRIKLDAALHLCALAANKRGLHFDNKSGEVIRLLGEKEDEASKVPPFTCARVVACGLKEGGRAYRGTEGWVLGVASRSNVRLDAASGVYLMKFATLLAPLLLQGPGPRDSDWQRRKEEAQLTPGTPFYASAQSSPTPIISQRLPVGPRRSRRKIPLASPPPGAPLPLPPVMAASVALHNSTRKTILRSTSRGSIKQGSKHLEKENVPALPTMMASQRRQDFTNVEDDDLTRSTVINESSRGLKLFTNDEVLKPKKPRMIGGLRLDTA